MKETLNVDNSQPSESELTCPKCGGPVKNIGKTEFKSSGNKPLITDLYICAGQPQCVHPTSYGGKDWPVEFILLDGKPHIVEPSASEFA